MSLIKSKIFYAAGDNVNVVWTRRRRRGNVVSTLGPGHGIVHMLVEFAGLQHVDARVAVHLDCLLSSSSEHKISEHKIGFGKESTRTLR